MQHLFLIPLFFVLASSATLPTQEITRDALPRIVNGYAIDIGEVPYQVALRRKVASGWVHACGAVIISNTAVLTAAHCVVSYILEPSSLRVTVGTSYRLSGGQSYAVSRVISHESYSATTLEHDIALLGVTTPIVFGTNVNAVAIASTTDTLLPGTEALVTGYGTTSFEGSASSVLLAAKVYIVAQDTCARAYLRIASITSGMLCANAVLPPRDACQGDSGGPLVANNVLIGLVSWGEGCGDSVYPGVYTRISSYNTWIVNNSVLL